MAFTLQFPPHISAEAPPPVLLHACCAPCSAAIVEMMLGKGLKPTVFFCNPNIYPEKEYTIRKEELQRFLQRQGIDFADADYDHRLWCDGIRGYEHEPERGHRCQLCFNMRLLATARYAAAHGFPLFTTTLASSRWKDLNQIAAAGRAAAQAYPETHYWEQNWRKGGLTERRAALLRENNFYNQQYCGCEYSLQQMIEWKKSKKENSAV